MGGLGGLLVVGLGGPGGGRGRASVVLGTSMDTHDNNFLAKSVSR